MLAGRDMLSYFLRGVSGSFAVKVLGAGLTFLLSVFLARALGPAGYGQYAFLFSLAMSLGLIASLGSNTLNVRMVASYVTTGQWGAIRSLLAEGRIAILLASALLCGVLVASLHLLGSLDAWGGPLVFIAVAMVPLLAISHQRVGALRGLRRVVKSHVPEMLVVPGFALSVGFLLHMVIGAERFTSATALSVQLAAVFTAFVIGTVFLLRSMPEQVGRSPRQPHRLEWFHAAVPLLVVTIMQLVKQRGDVILLGALTTPEIVGKFFVAAQLVVLIAFFNMAVTMTLQPVIASLWVEGRTAKLQRVLHLCTLAGLAVALPIGLIFIFAAEQVIGLAYGSAYSDAAICLVILSVGRLIFAATGPMLQALTMTGHESDAAWMVAISAVVSIALYLLLIPRYGMEGAALAHSISLVLWNFLLGWRLYVRTGLIALAFVPFVVLFRSRGKK